MEIIEVQKDILSMEEAATYLGFKIGTLRTYINKRIIPYYKAKTGKVYFKLDELRDYALARYFPSNIQMLSKAELRSLEK